MPRDVANERKTLSAGSAMCGTPLRSAISRRPAAAPSHMEALRVAYLSGAHEPAIYVVVTGGPPHQSDSEVWRHKKDSEVGTG